MKYFSPDSLHLNKKNFGSLHDYFTEGKHEFIQHGDLNHLIALYGDYSSLPTEMDEDFCLYRQYDFDMLQKAEIDGINLIDVCWLEFLSYISADKDFSKCGVVLTKENVFSFVKSSEKYKNAFILNLAAAAFWVKYWNVYLKKSPVFDAALVFSGSLAYARSLIEILKKTPTRVFLFETFFTGNDYYCEERFSPIPNASLLGCDNYYNNIKIDSDTYDRDRIKAINKIALSSNLNVKQPASIGKVFCKEDFVLIVGQVVNDFSVLGYGDSGLSTLALYSDLILKVLNETELNLVFKAHPWERKKKNLNSSVTADFLESRFAKWIGSRLFIVEDYNIEDLFSQARCVVLINSQSGIEAAWHGIKPIVLGDPFYGKKGFTVDLDVSRLDEVVSYISINEKKDYILTLEEYDFFEAFLVKSLVFSLVSKHKSGLILLREYLSPIPQIKLAKPGGGAAREVPVESKALNKPRISDNNTCDSSVTHSEISSFKRKFRKLKRDPKRFFLDSKNPILRKFGRLL